MLFRKASPVREVTVGGMFRRSRSDKIVEVAEVTGILPDGFGIPHVRYELTLERPYSRGNYKAGTKVLALAAFSATYRDAVL